MEWKDEHDSRGKRVSTPIKISVHTVKHLKYLKDTVPGLHTYDDAVDYLLSEAKLAWQCVDKDDFKKVIGDE